MDPFTREEIFLAAAAGYDVELPEPFTRTERFLAGIAEQSTNIPAPYTRVENFLAKIAGLNIDLPEPITREEQFLAKAAGMDVSIPQPHTRKEHFLKDLIDHSERVPVTFHLIEGDKLIVVGAMSAISHPDGLYLDCAPEWTEPEVVDGILYLRQAYSITQNGTILEVR